MVSIVVPIYNMEKYLPRCMKTLLAQTEKNIEIILIDDGSTDTSPKMCDEYAEKYPELVRVIHKENGGLSSARNAGIEEAKGKYIIFPDPDDWVEPEYIEKAVQYLKEYQLDLICLGHYIDYDDKCIPAHLESESIFMNQKKAKRAFFVLPQMNGFAWNKLYCLEVIKKNDLKFLDDVGTTEDLDFAFRYLDYCNAICFAPQERVYHYYQRSGAATYGNFSKKKLDSVKTYEKIISAAENDQIVVDAAKEEICNIAVNLCWLYKRDKCDDRESWEKIRTYLKKYLFKYLKSQNYNIGRKVQAILAYFVPDLYVILKDKVQER